MREESHNFSNVAKPALLLTAISAFSLLFSFAQEAVLAFYFGTGKETDAYTIAIQLPVIVFSVVSTSISTIVIPNYSKKIYGESPEKAKEFANSFISAITVITVIIIAIAEIFAKPLMSFFAPGLPEDVKELTVVLFRIILPTILLTELININTGILNVHKSFILPALTSNLLNISFVVCVVVFASTKGIYAAIWGTAIGTIIEFVYSVLLRRRYMRYRPTLELKDDMMKKSLKMALPVFVGIGADEVSKIVDKIVSSFLSEGSISALNYASKLSSAVSSLLISGISTVIYPEFAKHAAAGDKKLLARTLNYSLNLYLIIVVPIIFGGAYLSKDIIRLVFKRGVFDEESVIITAPLFACYLVCLLFTAVRTASSRYFYAQGDSFTPMKNSVIGIIINIILNIVLVRYLGTFGLALATTISMGIISFLILIDAKKGNSNIVYSSSIVVLLKVVFSCLLMTGMLFIVKRLFEFVKVDYISSSLYLALYIFLCVLIGGIVYFMSLVLIKTKEAQDVLRLLKRKKLKV